MPLPGRAQGVLLLLALAVASDSTSGPVYHGAFPANPSLNAPAAGDALPLRAAASGVAVSVPIAPVAAESGPAAASSGAAASPLSAAERIAAEQLLREQLTPAPSPTELATAAQEEAKEQRLLRRASVTGEHIEKLHPTQVARDGADATANPSELMPAAFRSLAGLWHREPDAVDHALAREEDDPLLLYAPESGSFRDCVEVRSGCNCKQIAYDCREQERLCSRVIDDVRRRGFRLRWEREMRTGRGHPLLNLAAKSRGSPVEFGHRLFDERPDWDTANRGLCSAAEMDDTDACLSFLWSCNAARTQVNRGAEMDQQVIDWLEKNPHVLTT